MDFAPIRVSVLRGDQKIGFDVYIEIGAKHILYLRKGDSFEGERLARLKQKKLKKMYIRQEDEELYRQYMSRNIEMAYDRQSNQTVETRAQVVQGLQQSAAENVFEDPTNEENYKAAKNETERFAEFLLNEEKAIKTLLAIENSDQNLAHHGVTVASVAVEIAKSSGVRDPGSLSLLALGGLLHDLGHFISSLPVGRPVSELSADELKVYHDHPHQGALRIQQLKGVDPQVARIIAEHEEMIDGGGFPSQLTDSKVNPLSLFVQSANRYDRLVTFEKVAPAEAVRRLISPEFIGKYPLEHLNAIKAAVQR